VSYSVDPKSLLFTDLTDEEAKSVEALATDIVLHGRPDGTHPAFTTWCNVAGYNSTQSLLVMSTAFPQRALLSLVRRAKRSEGDTAVAIIDGSAHVAGSDCCRHTPCRKCGGIQHYQAIYGGFIELCEFCDAGEWAKLKL